jgi:5-methylcytosine-specific restriction protein A
MIIARDPVCRACRRAWSVTADHIIPKARGGTDDESNLQGLCAQCHTAKTAGDAQAGRGG